MFQSDVEALIGKRPFEHKKLLDETDDEIIEASTTTPENNGSVVEPLPA